MNSKLDKYPPMKTSPAWKSSTTTTLSRTVPHPSSRWKATILCAALSLGIGAAGARTGSPQPSPGGGGEGGNEKEGVFNEFAGSYSGNASLSGTASAFGTARGFVRRGMGGGGLTLRADVAANGQSLRVKRILTFKRRTFKSKSLLLGVGTNAIGSGRGRFASRTNFLRYNETSSFDTGGGVMQTINITGDVRFFRNSMQATEIWSVTGQSLVFRYRLRPR
jgi:hypothetical protein